MAGVIRAVLLLLAIAGSAESAGKIIVQGAGASFPNLLYQDLIFAYQFVAPDVTLSYLATGSTGGKCRIMDFTEKCVEDTKGKEHIDFAGSDSLLKSTDYDSYPDLQMFPTVAGGIVPVINIPLLDRTVGEMLVIDREVLSFIFMGNITKWNDQRVLSLQSPTVSAKLAQAAYDIKIMVRKDGSGSTEVLTKSLNLFSDGAFSKFVGKPGSKNSVWDKAANPLNIKKLDFASGVAAAVLLTPWSIGYSSSGEAALHNLPIPSFRQNSRQKNAIAANIDSVAFAMLEKGLQFGNNGDDPARLTADIMDASGDQAWPIATFTYLVIRNGLQPTKDRLRTGATCANVQATVEFWNWFYTSELASRISERNYFVPLPDLVRQPVLLKLRSLKCAGGPALKDSDSGRVDRIIASGIADDVVNNILGLYASVYTSVDEWSEITFSSLPSSQIDVTKRLAANEAFKVVIGDDVYTKDWVAPDLAKVVNNGMPVQKPWDEIHPATGSDTSLVLPWFTFAIHFVVNIPGQPDDEELVLTPNSITKILDGLATNWTDIDITIDNPWIDSLSPAPGLIKVIAKENQDTIYEYMQKKLSNGFKKWGDKDTIQLQTYEQMVAIATGSPGAIAYGPFMGDMPKNARFASIKWTGAPVAVMPSYDSVLTCTKGANPFNSKTLAFTPNPAGEGCYPMTLTANTVFHHSFAELEKFCFEPQVGGKGAKGTGVPAVQFWKWMFETGENVEKAIVSQNAVPLLHTVNNTAQMNAAIWMLKSIQCAHPPRPLVKKADLTLVIVLVVVGTTIIAVAIFIGHVVTTRHAMQSNPLRGTNVHKVLLKVLEDVRPNTSGEVATYIPELGMVPPDLFGICLCTVDGTLYRVGDCEYDFSIQSMSKPLGYAHALDQCGVDHMKLKVNVEPAGGAFDTIEMDDKNRPFNPFINSGAIAVSMQLRGDMKERYEVFRQFMSGFCNRQVQLDESIYKSESSTAVRNREIADKLELNKICETPYDKEHGLEAYFMMCSTLLNTADLAALAGTCANNGKNPISKKQIVDSGINEEMMSVMMTCGMYNGAGDSIALCDICHVTHLCLPEETLKRNWMVDVGIPAKSGVGGAIFGVVPGICGLSVFSPRLNASFNSVRGIEACTLISQRLGLHVLQKSKSKVSFWEAVTGVRKPREQQVHAPQPVVRTGNASCDQAVRKGWAVNRVASDDLTSVMPFSDNSPA